MPDTDTINRDAKRTGGLAGAETVMPANWPETCAEFARAYHGEPVQVLTLRTALETQSGGLVDAHELATDLRLAEVAAVAAVPLPNIDIRLYDTSVRTVQRIEQPKALVVEHAANGEVIGLRIDDAEGVTTLVRLRRLLPS
jgi:hypothetical protein